MKICLFVLVCALMVCLVTSAQGDPPSDDDSSQNSEVSDGNTNQEVVTPRINVHITYDPVAHLGIGYFGIKGNNLNHNNVILKGEINHNFFHPQEEGHILAYIIGHIMNENFELEPIAPGVPRPNALCYQVIQRLIHANDFEIVPPGENLGDVIN